MLGQRIMLTVKRLRIEPNDGSPTIEYRIGDDRIERRNVAAETRSAFMEGEWQPLTPEQLGSEVLASPVLARWLSRRLGVHTLIEACSRTSASDESARTPNPCARAGDWGIQPAAVEIAAGQKESAA